MKIIRLIECTVEPSDSGWLAEFSVGSVPETSVVIFLRDREMAMAEDLDARYPKGFTDDWSRCQVIRNALYADY